MVRLGIMALSLALIGGSPAATVMEESPVTETAPAQSDAGDEGSQVISSVDGDAQESSAEPEAEPEREKNSTVVSHVYWVSNGETIEDGANKYGDVYLSQEDGYSGDEVTAIVSGNPTVDFSSKVITLYRYAVSYVEVNGSRVEAYDSGRSEYRFTLAEGINDVRVYFSGRIELSVTDITTVDWKSLLTVDSLLKLIYFVLTMILSSGFFITLIRSRKLKSKTVEEISKATEATVQAVTNKNVSQFLTEDVRPLLAKQSEQLADASDTSRVLMRCMLLSQENTPEARLAITKELQNYKTSDTALAEQIQALIEQSIKKNEEDKAAKEQAIQDARDSVNSLGSDTEATQASDGGNGSGSDYGTV